MPAGASAYPDRFGKHNYAGWLHPQCSSRSVDHREKRVPVAPELGGADARNARELDDGARAPRGHFAKRLVVEDDIGWHALGLGELDPLGTQPLEERLIHSARREAQLSCFRLAPRFFRDAQPKAMLAAQKLAALLRDRQAAMA